MPPRLTPAFAVALLLAAPAAVAQSTLGEILDLGAQKLSGEQFKQSVVQHPLSGLTPAGGNIEVMYLGNGTIVGIGTASRISRIPVPVSGQWMVDDQQRICTTMELSIAGVGGGTSPVGKMTLPTRCQFWFKHGEGYFLAESDSDRHARLVPRNPASLPSASAPLTLPAAMKGTATFFTTQSGAVDELSLAISKMNENGTFEGTLTIAGLQCRGKDVPVGNGVSRDGEVRFEVSIGMACRLDFRLRKGADHLLEGDAEDRRGPFGAGKARVWLDPAR